MNFKRSMVFSCMILAALLMIAGAGCRKKGAPNAGTGKETVIAEFDGGKVTAEEINSFIDYIASFNPMAKMELQDPAKKEMFINQIIDSTVLANAAKAAGLDKDADNQHIIKLQMAGILAQDYFKKNIKPLADKVQVPDAELKDYYDKHSDEFDQTKIKARQIIVATEEEAKDIYAKVKANPASFATLAKEKSKDGNASKGGDLGWISRGQNFPEFEKVAFALQKGQISEPFQSRFGWDIVMLDDKSEVSQIPFDQAKDSISAKLSENKKRDAGDKAVSDLKTKAHLKIHKELFSKVGVEISLPSGHPPMGGGTPPPPPAQPQQ